MEKDKYDCIHSVNMSFINSFNVIRLFKNNSFILVEENGKIVLTLSNSKYDLILKNNQWEFVKHNEYSKTNIGLEKGNDIVKIIDDTDMNLFPEKDSESICKLKNNSECKVYGENDKWLLVSNNKKIGFVLKKNTVSLKQMILDTYPNLKYLEVYKLNYINDNTSLYDSIDGNVIKTINKNNTIKVLQYYGDYAYCLVDDKLGYINKKYINELEGTYAEIEIEDQIITLHYNNDFVLVGASSSKKEHKYGIKEKYPIKETGNRLSDNPNERLVSYWLFKDKSIHDIKSNKIESEYSKGSHSCTR